MRSCVVVALGLLAACGVDDDAVHLTIAASDIGKEGEALRARLDAWRAAHPDVAVEIRATPDAGDQRHQVFVQWLNAGAREPDLLQLDVVWTPEFAAAGWLAPLDDVDVRDFFAASLRANAYEGRLYAAPWFVDVGLLYRRTDLAPSPPSSLEALGAAIRARPSDVPVGLAFQGARYEGLVCAFLEVLAAEGGAILDERGAVVVDAPAGARALRWLVDVARTSAPGAASWQEEQARFSFQNGEALFMRNWPYAAPLLAASSSKVAGRFAVSPLSGGGALGGQSLAINARTRHPREARALLSFLIDDDAQRDRARIAGEYPPRASLYDDGSLDGLLPIEPATAKQILRSAVPRPSTPLWSELSGILQVHLHRALTQQVDPQRALDAAATAMRAVLAARAPPPGAATAASPTTAASTTVTTNAAAPPAPAAPPVVPATALVVACLVLALLAALAPRRRTPARSERRFALALAAPALLLLGAVAVAPLASTMIESLYDVDLRAPWRGAPFVAVDLYVEALGDARFQAALVRTAAFTAISVALELVLGLALALTLARAFAGRGVLRALVLLPWAIPTVVAGIVWRFLADVNAPGWETDASSAFVPIVLADVWKTTPFVMLLLLAGLTQIDPAVYEAAALDGAGPWRRLTSITLPSLRPTILVALVFRTLDAVRVFDLPYVMTGGGPGTATEPVSLLAFDVMMRDLRFGAGAAMSMIVFAFALALALFYVRRVGEQGEVA